jgi:outer membrane receptor for ferrienterochelin and colicins
MLRGKTPFFIFILLLPALLHAQKDTVGAVNKLLELSLEDLMNIKVVTASGYLQTTAEAPSTITVISARQIAERGYEQLEDALRDIPGIDMIHINGYAPTLIYFRGMYGAENLRALLMIDGIVENNILGSNDMAGPAYSLHNVERIEIIWGPVSALYGANAFGGVINIISKKGTDINGLHAEQGFGSFNTSFEKISFGLKKSGVEFAVAGTLYSSNGPVFSNRDPNYSSSYVDKARSINALLSYDAGKSKTTIGYRSYRTPIGWGTYANSPTTYLGLPAQGNSNSGVIGLLQSNIRGEKPGLDDSYLRTFFAQEEYNPNEKINMMGRFVYRETGTAEDSYLYVTLNGTKLIRAGVASYSNRVSGEYTINYTPLKNHHISAGIQFYQDNVEAGSRQSTTDAAIYLIDGRDSLTNLHTTFLPRQFDIRNNFGSFFQYNINTKLLRKTNFTLGGRYDRNSYFGDEFSPRLAIVNQPSERLTFKFQFGKAFRAPTNLEIYQTPAASNFQLKQEKIHTYEFNALYSVSKQLRLQVNGFRNELRDVIVLGNLVGLNPDKNPALLNITGIEAVADLVFSKDISAYANFTYQDARGENLITHYKGPIPGVAKYKGNTGITLKTADLFILNLTENWIGKRQSPRTDPYGPVNGYCLTNISISTVPLFTNKITASVTIHNLFNTKWLDPGFRTADGNIYSTVLEQPGITGMFKITVKL